MDVDALQRALRDPERQPDYDIHMISPSDAQDDDEEAPNHYFPLASSPSSYDNFVVSPLAVSPAGATEDAREHAILVSHSVRTVVSPSDRLTRGEDALSMFRGLLIHQTHPQPRLSSRVATAVKPARSMRRCLGNSWKWRRSISDSMAAGARPAMIHESTASDGWLIRASRALWAKSSRIFLTSCPVCQDYFPHPRPRFREILVAPPIPRYPFERWMWRA